MTTASKSWTFLVRSARFFLFLNSSLAGKGLDGGMKLVRTCPSPTGISYRLNEVVSQVVQVSSGGLVERDVVLKLGLSIPITAGNSQDRCHRLQFGYFTIPLNHRCVSHLGRFYLNCSHQPLFNKELLALVKSFDLLQGCRYSSLNTGLVVELVIRKRIWCHMVGC